MRVARAALHELLPENFPAPLAGPLEKLLRLDAMDQLCEEAAAEPEFPRALLDRLEVGIAADEQETQRIPEQGPLVVVANHPFGMAEAATLAVVLKQRRSDVKFLANGLIGAFPPLAGRVIPVDVFGGRDAPRRNLPALRAAIQWLRDGGALAVFPAGEVSRLQPGQWGIVDPAWSSTIGGIVRRANATAVPVFIEGSNSALFQLAGLIHPRLQTALLPHELLNKRAATIRLHIGKAVEPRLFASCATDQAIVEFLRWRTYSLGRQTRARRAPAQALAGAADPAELAEELARLPEERHLAAAGALEVHAARAGEIPTALKEIGRLREQTFRAVGEGSGRAVDLDRFDAHYWQLILWNRVKREIAGGYRLGPTAEIAPRYGRRGLYTHTLFRYHAEFLRQLGPAIELGRSFLTAPYQKSYAGLLLMWKAIAAFVAQRPECRFLFGPVSISNAYHPASRELMVAWLEEQHRHHPLRRFVSARRPFRPPPAPVRAASLDELSAQIAGIEPDGKGVPVLLRQYLQLGGELLAFHVDPSFQDCVDGLLLLDLQQADLSILERYTGRKGSRGFSPEITRPG